MVQFKPQQSVLALQPLLPVAMHDIGWVQVLATGSHTPEQQVVLFAQVAPWAPQAWVQVLLLESQLPLQQSDPVAHVAPVIPQALAQVLLLGSQMPLQQSAPVMQAWLGMPQEIIPPSPLPPSPFPPSIMFVVTSEQPLQRTRRTVLSIQSTYNDL
jgi:hypothetical protein